MKHLKMFNENKAQKYIDVYNILKDVFAELIDDTSIQVDFSTETYNGQLSITILPWTKNQMAVSEMTPEGMINKYERILELVKDVSVCFKRATEELAVESELVVSVDNRIYCNFKIDKEEKYPF